MVRWHSKWIVSNILEWFRLYVLWFIKGIVWKKLNKFFSQRLSVISLIHKKGEKNLPKNYRPISLTNSDYKIIAFIFAKRLQKIIGNLISKDKSAYIKGCYIGENARLI